MRRLNQRVAALAAAMLLPLAAQAPMAQRLRPVAAEGAGARVIVKYRADSDMMKKQAMTATGRRILQAQALGERIGVALVAGTGISDRAHVVTARGLSSASLAARLSAQPDVEFAVVDERRHLVAVPNDPLYASRAATANSGGPVVGQWYLKPPGPERTAANTGAGGDQCRAGLGHHDRQRQHRRRRARHRRAQGPSRPAGRQRAARLRHGRTPTATARSRPRTTATAATPTRAIRATS